MTALLGPPTHTVSAVDPTGQPVLAPLSPQTLRIPSLHLDVSSSREGAPASPEALPLDSDAREGAEPVRVVVSAEEIKKQTQRIQSLVAGFAIVLEKKLLANAEKRDWQEDWTKKDWAGECRQMLQEHLLKGDPRDVGILAAFCWYHEWSTDPTLDGQSAVILTHDREAYDRLLGENIAAVSNEQTHGYLLQIENNLQRVAAKAFLQGQDHEAVTIRGLARDVQDLRLKLVA